MNAFEQCQRLLFSEAGCLFSKNSSSKHLASSLPLPCSSIPPGQLNACKLPREMLAPSRTSLLQSPLWKGIRAAPAILALPSIQRPICCQVHKDPATTTSRRMTVRSLAHSCSRRRRLFRTLGIKGNFISLQPWLGTRAGTRDCFYE